MTTILIIGFFIFALFYKSEALGFVKRDNLRFVQDGKGFYFAGCNEYNLFTKSKADIDKRFGDMKMDGMKVVRTNGFSHTFKAFEPRKGVYDENQFQVMDYILKVAKEHGIYLILTLENYWDSYGGIDTRLAWEGLPNSTHKARAKFYTHAGCKEGYKNYVKYFATRVNTLTGVVYKDDPTIFSYELMNEPRYQDSGEDVTGITLRRWVDEMAAFIKLTDPNHMVSAGLEGHGTKYHYGGDEGNPFVYIHQSPYIDFATGHLYPDTEWNILSYTEAARVTFEWIMDANMQCKKPFVLEEFNSRKNKEDYWKAVFRVVENFGNGETFWHYLGYEERYSDYDIWHGHPILDSVFKEHAQKMNNKF